MKQRNVTEGCAGMGKEDTMPVIFMEEKIMLEAEYEKAREKIEGKEDDRLKEERIQTLQTIFPGQKANCRKSANRLNRFITEMSLPPESMTQRKKRYWSGALLV